MGLPSGRQQAHRSLSNRARPLSPPWGRFPETRSGIQAGRLGASRHGWRDAGADTESGLRTRWERGWRVHPASCPPRHRAPRLTKLTAGAQQRPVRSREGPSYLVWAARPTPGSSRPQPPSSISSLHQPHHPSPTHRPRAGDGPGSGLASALCGPRPGRRAEGRPQPIKNPARQAQGSFPTGLSAGEPVRLSGLGCTQQRGKAATSSASVGSGASPGPRGARRTPAGRTADSRDRGRPGGYGVPEQVSLEVTLGGSGGQVGCWGHEAGRNPQRPPGARGARPWRGGRCQGPPRPLGCSQLTCARSLSPSRSFTLVSSCLM